LVIAWRTAGLSKLRIIGRRTPGKNRTS
jgi:hypothetical protein